MLMRFTAVVENKYSQRASVVRTFNSPGLDLPTTPKRVSGAPILSVSLEIKDGFEELKQENRHLRMNFRARVAYHGVESADSTAANPIAFHCNTFLDEINYRLYCRHRDEDDLWKHCPHSSICHFLADDPDPVVEVNIAPSEDFVSLRPGESWSAIIELDDELWDFPNDLQPGDVFRFVFKVATID
ncbi:uncharacterized protein N7529_011477 [Penicillium soppii]|uniref:uncharacterized protein n=1 Tax=Penicillium soppii TaxID=69789 RepID=UPI002546F527|nr:uncharacterized protein N7529_011477 [Penicillium soppii]KAJ5852092.1 hypothetical protein N7529_011477 [Penicillium soppii]